MITRLSCTVFAYALLLTSSCKTERTNSTHAKPVVTAESGQVQTESAEVVQASADGHTEASLVGKFGKQDESNYFLEVDEATKVRLDLATNNVTPPADGNNVTASGYFLETENGEVFVVESVSGSDGAELSLAQNRAARPAPIRKPPVQKSYWRCVGTVVYPLQCVLFRSGANGATKTEATNNALTACKTICPYSKNAQCVIPPPSRLFPIGSTTAQFVDSMGGCAYYDAAKRRWRR